MFYLFPHKSSIPHNHSTASLTPEYPPVPHVPPIGAPSPPLNHSASKPRPLRPPRPSNHQLQSAGNYPPPLRPPPQPSKSVRAPAGHPSPLRPRQPPQNQVLRSAALDDNRIRINGRPLRHPTAQSAFLESESCVYIYLFLSHTYTSVGFCR